MFGYWRRASLVKDSDDGWAQREEVNRETG